MGLNNMTDFDRHLREMASKGNLRSRPANPAADMGIPQEVLEANIRMTQGASEIVQWVVDAKLDGRFISLVHVVKEALDKKEQGDEVWIALMFDEGFRKFVRELLEEKVER